jgi:hypothetical protein
VCLADRHGRQRLQSYQVGTASAPETGAKFVAKKVRGGFEHDDTIVRRDLTWGERIGQCRWRETEAWCCAEGGGDDKPEPVKSSNGAEKSTVPQIRLLHE